MELLSLSAQSHGAVRTTEDAMAKQYEFWSTQPVPKISKHINCIKWFSIRKFSIFIYLFFYSKTDEDITANEAIEQNKPLSEIRPEPYSLPPGFVWDTMTLDNPQTVISLYTN